MILNAWTVSAFFFAGVGFMLAVAAGVTGVRCLATKDAQRARDRAHLLTLLVAVLALVRALAWPQFYWLLESYVPALAPNGAMCSYGVTLVQPALVLALQWIKPLLLALLAAWWTLAAVDSRTESATFLQLRCLSMVPLAALALVECSLEARYLGSDKLGRPVTCCTQFSDLESSRVSGNASPLALAGFDSPVKTLAAYAVLNLLVCGLALMQSGQRALRPTALARTVILLLALGNLVVTRWAWLDAVAPRVLGLPYHHCVYEVFTRAPVMGLAAMFTVAGNLGLAGLALLDCLRSRSPAAIDEVRRRMQRHAALALLSALMVVAVHIA